MRREAVMQWAMSLALLVSTTAAAHADLTVANASGVNVTVGNKLPDDYIFDLPANAELRVLRSSDEKSFVIRGPYKGTLTDFIASCTGLLSRFRSYCRTDTDGDRLPVGGTRGAR
jgi:hypothetical protein